MTIDSRIDCIEVHPDLGFRSIYHSPFETSIEFTDSWWDTVPSDYENGNVEFLLFRMDDLEVARAQILLNRRPNPDYGVFPVASAYIDLAFFEVASSHVRRGIGTLAVQALSNRYPHVGLLAYSEEADAFWNTLGWHRYEHPEGTLSFRPLYVRAPLAAPRP